jgi:altronate dehydratase
MNTSNKYKLEVWIGLAKVNAKNKNVFKNANNAYVNVIGLANNKNNFRERVKEELLQLNLSLTRLEDVEIFNNRVQSYRVDKVLYKLADELLKNGKWVKFSKFHTYE